MKNQSTTWRSLTSIMSWQKLSLLTEYWNKSHQLISRNQEISFKQPVCWSTTKPKQEPWWKRRIEKDIEFLRKDLSVIASWFSGKWKNRGKVKMDYLNRKYHLKKLDFKTSIETIRQRISSKATKVRRHNKRCLQFQQNRLSKWPVMVLLKSWR